MANITNYSRSNSVKKGVNSVKEGVFCQVFFYEQKGYSCRRLLFSQGHFTRDATSYMQQTQLRMAGC